MSRKENCSYQSRRCKQNIYLEKEQIKGIKKENNSDKSFSWIKKENEDKSKRKSVCSRERGRGIAVMSVLVCLSKIV